MTSTPTPDWVRHAIWWQVFPLGAVGAESVQPAIDPSDLAPERIQHRLPRLLDWLDYAVRLGCSGLSLGPLFHSYSHGYDTLDYYRVDPRLGDRADLDALLAAAHDRGLRVMLDGVFNHAGRDNPMFARVVDHGPGAPEEGFFRLTWPADAGPGTVPEYETFEGHTGLMALDHANPAVADFVVDVMCHWMEAGIDAWRLDAAYAVPPGFWTRVLPRVRERFPQAYIVGEVIHGDYVKIVTESGMDSVTQYELWKAIWSSIGDHNFHELDWTLRRHSEFVRTFVPQTFVGNHDVTRIASRIADPRHLPHAVVILFTVAGTPSVYYGDEQGYHGVKAERLGGDDQIRPVLPDGPGDFSGLGAWVHELYRELIGLRRRHPWLHGADTRVLSVSDETIVYESTSGFDRLVVALNLGDEPATLAAPRCSQVLAGPATVASAVPSAVAVAANGWAVLA